MPDDWTHALWVRCSRGPWQRVALAHSEAEALLIAKSYRPSVAYRLESCHEAPADACACPPLAWRVLPRGQAPGVERDPVPQNGTIRLAEVPEKVFGAYHRGSGM